MCQRNVLVMLQRCCTAPVTLSCDYRKELSVRRLASGRACKTSPCHCLQTRIHENIKATGGVVDAVDQIISHQQFCCEIIYSEITVGVSCRINTISIYFFFPPSDYIYFVFLHSRVDKPSLWKLLFFQVLFNIITRYMTRLIPVFTKASLH